MKKRIEITIMAHQVKVIRFPRASCWAWCASCAKTVKMVSAEEAAAITDLSVRDIYRQVEAGVVHFLETIGSRLLLCLNSVLVVGQDDPQSLD